MSACVVTRGRVPGSGSIYIHIYMSKSIAEKKYIYTHFSCAVVRLKGQLSQDAPLHATRFAMQTYAEGEQHMYTAT